MYKDFMKVHEQRTPVLRYLVLGILLLLLWLVGCQPGQLNQFIPAMRTPMLVPTFTPTPELLSAAGAPTEDPAFVDAQGLDLAERRIINVYERVAPSVVSITTQVLRRGFFFEVPEEGAGSGFILDQEGHILTNYHVIDGAQSIDVSINDDFVAPATVVGIDRRNDIAVLKVEAPAEILRPSNWAVRKICGSASAPLPSATPLVNLVAP